MDRGYEGASVDEIARAAGTSKATLYSYFPDKRQLFEAVMQTQCSRTGEVMRSDEAGEPVEVALRRMAASFAHLPVLARRPGDVPGLHRRGRALSRARRGVPRLRPGAGAHAS